MQMFSRLVIVALVHDKKTPAFCITRECKNEHLLKDGKNSLNGPIRKISIYSIDESLTQSQKPNLGIYVEMQGSQKDWG